MLCKVLKSLRQSKGLKCSEVTESMSISEKQLHYIERNAAVYSVLKLAKHVQALNYRVEIRFIDLEDSRNVIVYEVKGNDNDNVGSPNVAK